jgi:hypothetical protein
MCAKCVEELLVYQKALEASHAVSAILKRSGFDKDLRLRDQLGASSERTVSAIAEGFSQSTDRHFASYLYRSRGFEQRDQNAAQSRVESRLHHRRRNKRPFGSVGNRQMLTGLIAHLRREDRQSRP